jgi:prepilin-type N-terminal cleavage/methylation domain-containing protein/prepilin-type processing-associated H-X9-DG protein
MTRNSRFSRAFTLIELIVVLAVIAILMSMVYPMYTSISERAKATKDMSNLRQIGLATQTYLNDNDGVLFSPATTWMSQLNPKYFSAWRGFQSPFDKRPSSEAGTGTPVSPISYGVNVNIYPGGAAMSATKITKPTGFILFAPAQDDATTVKFQGVATTGAPGVTLRGFGNTVTSNPPGSAVTAGGTHNSRQRINALFADLHCETMSWTTFSSTTASAPGQPDQWTPYTPYP